MKETDLEFVERLIHDFPEVRFVKNRRRFSYRWQNDVPTVFLGEPQPKYSLLTLHELGHAASGHKDYQTTVERLKIESEAWSAARKLFLKYQKTSILPADWSWDEDFAESKLDTYRNWLHTKTTCKTCGLTMYQTTDGIYHCPLCDN